MRCNALVISMLVIACGPSSHGHGDDDDSDANHGGPDAPACATASATASSIKRPVDIIWVIDNSGSMDEEEARIQTNMNLFASAIAASGADYRVIAITDTTHINVPAPLGGSPQFLAVNINIDSHDALQQVIAAYPQYQAFLRPDSVKHIVPVTDDESDMSKAAFETALGSLASPGFGTDWKFHAVVAEAPPWDFNSHCFGLSAAVGSVYIALQTAHGGQFFSLCTTDWTPLFATLAASVSQGLELPCTFALPAPPDGEQLDPSLVNFVYTPGNGGPATTIGGVSDAAACGTGPGWFYDNPQNPTQIIACPATCATLQGDATGKVDVQFGCATILQ